MNRGRDHVADDWHSEGFIASEPIPPSRRIGIKLASTARTVMGLGRNRCAAPSIAAASISACLFSTSGKARFINSESAPPPGQMIAVAESGVHRVLDELSGQSQSCGSGYLRGSPAAT